MPLGAQSASEAGRSTLPLLTDSKPLNIEPAAADKPSPMKPLADSPTACPSAQDTSVTQLYGLWRTEESSGSPVAEITLHRHPEMTGSVRGNLSRANTKAQVAGDVDNGDFTLEESENGENISATWIGRVVEGSCGKEIKGTWTNAAHTQERPFLLRKQPGWR